MICAVFIIGLILVFPFIVTAYFYYNFSNNKLYFAIFIFNKIKLFSGYFNKRSDGGFYIHLKDNYALIVDKNSLYKLKNGNNYFNKLEINLLYLIVDVGLKSVNLVMILSFLTTIISKISYVYYKNNNLPKIITNLNVYESFLGVIGAKLKIIVSFNLICILQSVIANAISKGLNYVKRKKVNLKRKYS